MRRLVLSLASLVGLAITMAVAWFAYLAVLSATGSGNLALGVALALTVLMAGALGLVVRRAREESD